MTHRNGHIVIICDEPEAPCQFCGVVDELRPYGPNGERICYVCAMKDQATSRRKCAEFFGWPE